MLAEQIDAGARRVLEVFLETARKALLGWFNEASVNFQEDPVFNATASLEWHGRPLFGFQLGCAFALYDAFMSLIAHPEFFPEVPLDRTTVLPGPERIDRFCDYSWIASDPPPTEQVFLPKRMTLDTSRFGLGDHLFEMAVRFLFYHEQVHYMLGHLGMADRSYEAFVWHEIAHSLPPELPPERLRPLELEADAHAASLLFHAGRNELERQHAHWKGISTPLDWDRALLVALGVLFMVEEENEHLLGGAGAAIHPTAAARTVSMFHLHAHMAGAEPRGNRGARIFLAQRVLGDLGAAAELIGVIPMRPKDFLAGTGAAPETWAFHEYLAEREQLRQQLASLHPFRVEVASALGFQALPLPETQQADWFEARAWQAPLGYRTQAGFRLAGDFTAD